MNEIFGLIFLLQRRLELVSDKHFEKSAITTKQWFVLAVIEKLFTDKSPTIRQVAQQMNMSHQNIKAIAINLEKKGFIKLVPDIKDKRATRLAVTAKSKRFWKRREEKDKQQMAELFGCFNKNELSTLNLLIKKLIEQCQIAEDKHKARVKR